MEIKGSKIHSMEAIFVIILVWVVWRLCFNSHGAVSKTDNEAKTLIQSSATDKQERAPAKVSTFYINEELRQPKTNQSKVIYSHVAGVPHRFGREVNLKDIFSTGDSLFAVRDRNNIHDKAAVKLYKGNVFVGYLAKIDNSIVATHLDNEETVAISVSNIQGEDIWHGVKLKISLL